ncbi:MAG: hypothetical protein ABSG43_08750 [Solirubrobacteraceae bacterium]|jgi:hypothetical protein
MHDRIRGFGLSALLVVALACLTSACGAGSGGAAGRGDATKLLQQTFSGSHTVTSGNLKFALTITPSGSGTLTGPVVVSLGGPFQGLGAGKLPKSDFTVAVSAQGLGGSLGILSTGTNGYVTFDGSSYQLPAASFRQLESSFSGLTASSSSGPGSGTLATLGIDPLHWLVDPTVVGTETVGGVATTHVHAGVNLSVFLADLSTFLQKASSLHVTGAAGVPSGLSAATRAKLASTIRNASVDVWTGNSDKIVRRLEIDLSLPVTGSTSTMLGGMSSAGLAIDLEYAGLNQPQTITAPTSVQPYSAFQAKLRPLLQSIGGGLLGGVGTGSLTKSASTTAAVAASSSGSAASVQSYSKCISAAHNDVAKMQNCASLLNAK